MFCNIMDLRFYLKVTDKNYDKVVSFMESKYISPFTDFGFKKLFGEEGNKNLLVSFLNDLLPIKNKIVDISFKENQQLGDDFLSRSAVYDIFCEDEKNNQFIVEMQNARQTYFRDRAVFYSTFPIREQAKKGLWNFKLKEVYCVGLLGFNLDDTPTEDEEVIWEYIHTVNLKDPNNKLFYNKLTYLFIELPRFDKKETEIKTHFEKWMYFLKNLDNFDNIPAILQEEVFEEAFKVAEIANYTPDQRREYESSLKSYRDNINVIETAREEGREERTVEIARNLLFAGTNIETIATVTGLTKQDIEKLRQEQH